MALTCYCKKCNRDVPASDTCECCGGKLARSQARCAWCIDRKPVCDWISWNEIMRLYVPVLALAVALALLLELLLGGVDGLVSMLRGGFLSSLLALCAVAGIIIAAVLWLQDDEVLDCVIDAKGVHVQYYLPEPAPLKLLLRLKPLRLMRRTDAKRRRPVLFRQQEILWKDVARVQLWPEKNMVLLYAPALWLRVAVPCTPFVWTDTLDMIRDRLGKKKQVLLPAELRVIEAPTKKRKAKPPRADRHPKPFQSAQEDDRPHARMADEA